MMVYQIDVSLSLPFLIDSLVGIVSICAEEDHISEQPLECLLFFLP